MSSQLDFQQILQTIFDPASGRIGTNSTVETHKFTIKDKSRLVTTENQLVLDENEERHYLLIQNAGKKRIWINFDEPATPGFPSVLLPAQATLIYEDNNLYVGSVNAIGDDDNIPLIIKEG
jgi:hypothetical protein